MIHEHGVMLQRCSFEAMVTLKRLSQVNTHTQADEALQSAIEEFQIQVQPMLAVHPPPAAAGHHLPLRCAADSCDKYTRDGSSAGKQPGALLFVGSGLERRHQIHHQHRHQPVRT